MSLSIPPIAADADRRTVTVIVRHTCDRPVQIGSYYLCEMNSALQFDLAQGRGMRLNIAAGTSVRFEPGEEKSVDLVEFAGERKIFGHQGKGNQ